MKILKIAYLTMMLAVVTGCVPKNVKTVVPDHVGSDYINVNMEFNSKVLSSRVENKLPYKEYLWNKDKITNIIASDDGRFIASGSVRGNSIVLWGTKDQKPVAEFTLIKHKQHYIGIPTYIGIAFSPDSKYLAFGGNNRKIAIWDIKKKKMYRTIKLKHPVSTLSFSPDGENLAYANNNNEVKIFRVADSMNIATINTHGGVNILSYDHSGKRLVTVQQSWNIKVWDISKRKIIKSIRFAGKISSMEVSPDDQLIVALLYDRHKTTLGVWDLEGIYTRPVTTFKVATLGNKRYPHVNSGFGLDFSSDGKFLLSGLEGYAFNIWDINTRKLVKRIDIAKSRIGKIQLARFSKNDNEIISTSSLGNKIRSWRVTGQGVESGNAAVARNNNTVELAAKKQMKFEADKIKKFNDKHRIRPFNCPETKNKEFDKHNSLEYLGFTASRFLLKDGNATFYEARNTEPNYTSFSIVAIHDVADDEAIIDATTRYYSNGRVWGIQYSDGMTNHYTTSLLPCLSTLATKASPNWILHYNKSKRLFSTKENKNFSTISPPINTRFSSLHKYTAKLIPWTPKYIRDEEQVQRLGDGEANTLNKSIAKRTELDFLYGMSDDRKEKYLKEKYRKIQKKITSALVAKAEKKGVIYRMPSYWAQYNGGDKFEAIFNGNPAIEKTNGFAWLYNSFVSRYYSSCKKFIPPGSPGYDYTELTTISNSFSSTTFKSGSSKVRMKTKFFKLFKYYGKRAVMPGFSNNRADVVGILNTVMEARDPNKIKFAKEWLLNLKNDISRLYRDGKCNSAFLMQFEENLYRLANNLAPLQKDNKIHFYWKKDK